MSEYTYVKGKIVETVGGNYNIYSKGDIIQNAKGKIIETAPQITYGDAEPHPVRETPLPLVVVEFRPASTPEAEKYDSSFGFDYLRIDDSPVQNFDTPFFEVLNQTGYYDVKDSFTYKTYENKKEYYQALKKEYESQPIIFRQERGIIQGNEDDSRYYYIPYLSLYSKQYVDSLPDSTREGYIKPSYKAFLSLITEVSEEVDELYFEYNKDLFDLSLANPLETKKSPKKKHKDNLKITCKMDFDSEQEIKVYALPKGSKDEPKARQMAVRTFAGKIKVLPNSEKHRKKLRILLVQMKTDVDNTNIIQEGIFDVKQMPFIYKYLHQAYIEPEIEYYPENHKDSFVDATSDPLFKKDSKFLVEVTLNNGRKETQFKDMTGTEFYHLNKYLEQTYIPEGKKDCFVVFCFGIAKGDSAGETRFNSNRSILYREGNTTTAIHELCHGLGLLHTFVDGSFANKNGKYFFKQSLTSNLMDYSNDKPFLYKWQWEIINSRIQ